MIAIQGRSDENALSSRRALQRPGEWISCSPQQWQHWTRTTPPWTCGTPTRVSAGAFSRRRDGNSHWLTSSLVRPECIILLRRVILQNFREYPHGAVAKKKRRAAERVATFHERNGRVYWMLDVRPRNGGEGNGTVRRRFLLTPRWAGCGFAARGRLDDSATNRRACSHCLHASDWIVIFEGVGRRRRRRRRRALGVQRRERGTLGALRA